MTKERTRIPSDISAEALFASDTTCCVCEERGKAVQIHHLDENPDNHEFGNLAVLCLECHNQTQVRGGFGRSLTREIVARYRSTWLDRVADRRRLADQSAVQRRIGVLPRIREARPAQETSAPAVASNQESVLIYINSLPTLRMELLKRAQPEWDSGVTARVVQATYDYIDALTGILVHLAGYYPLRHFLGKDPHEFFADQIASRFAWHRSHAEPSGPGTGGTIVSVICCGNVQVDVEKMIEDMAMSLVGYDDQFDWKRWPSQWHGRPT